MFTKGFGSFASDLPKGIADWDWSTLHVEQHTELLLVSVLSSANMDIFFFLSWVPFGGATTSEVAPDENVIGI